LYIALAFLSALMWLAAASVRISKTAYLVPGVRELDAILKKLRLQSQLNAAGAFLIWFSLGPVGPSSLLTSAPRQTGSSICTPLATLRPAIESAAGASTPTTDSAPCSQART
jgi:hypothetical protein